MIYYGLFLVIALFASLPASATVARHGFTPAQEQEMAKHNEALASSSSFLEGLSKNFTKLTKSAGAPRVPFAEYTETGYLIYNDSGDFSSWSAKEGMARNLPQGVTLVVFTGDSSKSYHTELRNYFEQWIDGSRLKILFAPNAQHGFWARDGVPIPVWQGSDLSLVDARYYHNFEGDAYFAAAFSASLEKHSYYYEGGNFLSNAKGDCIIVNKTQTSQIPDSIFTSKYGCSTLLRLPHIKGIGHIDESVKFINDTTVITDSESYRKKLSQFFTVVMMPRPDREYETYVNSLIVNGTVFVPVFDEANDAKALKVYQDLGLTTVPLDSSELSNVGMGSLHCITMTYPPVPMKDLAAQLNAIEIL